MGGRTTAESQIGDTPFRFRAGLADNTVVERVAVSSPKRRSDYPSVSSISQMEGRRKSDSHADCIFEPSSIQAFKPSSSQRFIQLVGYVAGLQVGYTQYCLDVAHTSSFTFNIDIDN